MPRGETGVSSILMHPSEPHTPRSQVHQPISKTTGILELSSLMPSTKNPRAHPHPILAMEETSAELTRAAVQPGPAL